MNPQDISSTAFDHWIDNAPSPSPDRFTRDSPSHDVEVGSYARGTEADVDRAVAGARAAFEDGRWSGLAAGARAEAIRKAAALLRENAEGLALTETLESGKPLHQSRDEVEWAAGIWDYAAALARTLHGDTSNHIGAGALGLTLREPVGVVGLITPWNFPLLIASQKLPFALAAGCTVVLKPSELTPGTTLKLAALLAEAGLPAGVCQVVTGFGEPVGRRIAEHPGVDLVSFTGSTAVGRSVAAAAGQSLKRVALELGGKNPQVIFPDADLEAAADAVVFGSFFNMGECCNAGSRLLLHRDVPNSFLDSVVEKTKALKVGDPFDEDVRYGAIINQAQLDKIRGHVDAAKGAAEVRTGGGVMDTGRGRFFEPTVIAGVSPDQPIAREEVFGPVLSVVPFGDADEAVAIANSTGLGLSAGVWSTDHATLMKLARGIRAGTVWLNTFLDGTPELPFGGFGHSGLGRELGPAAVEEYTELKTVFMKLERFGSPWTAAGGAA